MDEREFWDRLEDRVTDEMYQMPDCRTRGLWCDGFLPEGEVLRGPGRHVFGACWVGFGGGGQARWSFRLMLKDHIAERGQIEWHRFLPRDDATGWLRVDWADERLVVWPRAVS